MNTPLPNTTYTPATLVDVLRWRAENQPERLAYTFLQDGEIEQERYTYAELDQKARAIAAWLQEQDAFGERVLLLYPSGLEYIASFFGCLYAGAIAVPAYPPRKNRSLDRIEGIVANADAKFTLTTEVILSQIEHRFKEDPVLSNMNLVATDKLDAGLAEAWEQPGITGDSLAFLQYTSGSTGQPKGVMISHGNLLHNEEQIMHAFGTKTDGVVVGWLPLYHDMGLIGNVLNAMYVGYPCYLMAPVAFLQKPVRWLQAISKYRATISGGPDFAYNLCVRKVTPEQVDELDLSTWELAYNGAEPVREETLKTFVDKFKSAGLSETAMRPCYGLAEATLFVTSHEPKSPAPTLALKSDALAENRVEVADGDPENTTVLVSCGHAWLGQEISIVDPASDRECEDGEVGEIRLSGPSVAKGYWRREEATAQTFESPMPDAIQETALRTGDLGFLKDGDLFVTGRLKDLIIIRGRNHYPQDIEATVENSHEALDKGACAAFALEIEGVEKLGVAVEVQRVKLRNLDEEDVIKAIRKAVSEVHELQTHAVLLLKPKSIPKTSSGKIQRHACRLGYLDGTLKTVASHALEANVEEDEPTEAFLDRAALSKLGQTERKTLVSFFLQQLVARTLKMSVSEVDPQQSLSSLGLDSLDTVELKLDIERELKVAVPMDEDLNDLTIIELAEKLSHQLGGDAPEAPVATSPSDWKDLFEKCDTDGGYFGKYRLQKDRYFTMPKLEGVPGPRMKFQGREVIVWSINNYLGLIGNQAVQDSAEKAMAEHGIWSPMGSRMLTGNTDRHAELERRLATYMQKEASILFNFGYMGVMGTIDAVTDGNDTIIIDSLSHACIVDGALIASQGKQFRVFRHNDMESLEKQLKDANETRKGGVLVVTEGVFGMTGDLGRLDDICDLKEKYNARLFVDDAHGFGVMGKTGAGVGEHQGVMDRIDLNFGTFAKSFVAIGGVTAGDENVIEYIRYNARTQIFAKSLPMVYVEPLLAALDEVENGEERRNQMWYIARRLQKGLKELGYNLGNTESPITPVYVPAGDEETATKAMKLLRTDYGIFVSAVTYPVVPRGVVLFRLTSSASHTDDDVDKTLEAFKKLREFLKLDESSDIQIDGDLVSPTG